METERRVLINIGDKKYVVTDQPQTLESSGQLLIGMDRCHRKDGCTGCPIYNLCHTPIDHGY